MTPNAGMSYSPWHALLVHAGKCGPIYVIVLLVLRLQGRLNA